jgi:hypothetical protein
MAWAISWTLVCSIQESLAEEGNSSIGSVHQCYSQPHSAQPFLRIGSTPSLAMIGTITTAATRISPPPAEHGVEKQSTQKDRRKVSAEIRLSRIGFHGDTPDAFGDLSLRCC